MIRTGRSGLRRSCSEQEQRISRQPTAVESTTSEATGRLYPRLRAVGRYSKSASRGHLGTSDLSCTSCPRAASLGHLRPVSQVRFRSWLAIVLLAIVDGVTAPR